MGAYVYAARSPKFARQIVVEWTQEYEYVERKTTQGYTVQIAEPRPVRPREIITVAVWSYLYKPWSGMQYDRFGMALMRRLDRLEQAWKDYSLPHAVVVSSDKRYRIGIGDEVIGWNRRANTSGYDDPDWGRACRYGKVVRVVGPADLDPPPHDHRCKRCNRGLKFDCTKRTCVLDTYDRSHAYDETGCYICERQQLDREQNR